eukprot:598425-Pleurochrysis_carterae.AAC.3
MVKLLLHLDPSQQIHLRASRVAPTLIPPPLLPSRSMLSTSLRVAPFPWKYRTRAAFHRQLVPCHADDGVAVARLSSGGGGGGGSVAGCLWARRSERGALRGALRSRDMLGGPRRETRGAVLMDYGIDIHRLLYLHTLCGHASMPKRILLSAKSTDAT